MVAKECPTPEPFNAVIGSVLFLTLLFFLSFISRFIFSPLMPSIVEDLGLGAGQAGSVFMIGSIGVFIGSVTSGFISSKITHKQTLVISVTTISLMLFATALITSLWHLWLIFFLISAASGLGLPSNMAVITAMVSRADWGKALAVQQMGPPSGLIIGPLFCVLLLPYFAWKVPLLFIAAFTLVVALVLARFARFGAFPSDPPNMAYMHTLLSLKSFWIIVVLFAMGIGGQVGVYAMLPLYLVGEQDLDPEVTNTLVGLAQISALFMTYFSGWVTDKIGEKRAIALFLSVSGIVTILLGIASGPLLKLVIFLQPALIVCFFPPGFAAMARTVQPAMRSLITAWATPMAFFLGGGLFPAALGYMGQHYTFATGLMLAGMVIIAGAFLVFSLNLLEKMEEGC